MSRTPGPVPLVNRWLETVFHEDAETSKARLTMIFSHRKEVFRGTTKGTGQNCLSSSEDPDRIFAPVRSRGGAELKRQGSLCRLYGTQGSLGSPQDVGSCSRKQIPF